STVGFTTAARAEGLCGQNRAGRPATLSNDRDPFPDVDPQGRDLMTPSTSTASVAILDLSRIAQDLQIRKVHVEAVVQMLDEGNTVPFITRYRKERTGGLTEEAVRRIRHRIGQLRHLLDRKQTIVKSIDSQGKLTDDLRNA